MLVGVEFGDLQKIVEVSEQCASVAPNHPKVTPLHFGEIVAAARRVLAGPRINVKGVRSLWLTLAKKPLFS